MMNRRVSFRASCAGLDAWWDYRKSFFPETKRVVINLNNGSDCSGHRTQFLKRVVEFADASELEVRLAYYPPYHSKYNPIERYRGGLGVSRETNLFLPWKRYGATKKNPSELTCALRFVS